MVGFRRLGRGEGGEVRGEGLSFVEGERSKRREVDVTGASVRFLVGPVNATNHVCRKRM